MEARRPAPGAMRRLVVLLTAVLVTAGCEVGPDYVRPSAPVPTNFKEAEGWKPAEPKEAASGEPWWSVYDDATLDGLERQIEVSNQTLKASEAAYRQAVALVDEARASFFPTVSVQASGTRSGSGGGGRSNLPSGFTAPSQGLNQFAASASASWAPDIWGRIRRTVESDVANAQASAADLAGALLSGQAALATAYFELRSTDAQKRLLDDTIVAFRRALQITQNQYNAGTAAKSDVITAQTQLQGAEAQEISLGVARAQFEHAIAVLIGKAPAEFSLAPAPLPDRIPVVPAGVPSALLERRPDIAASERQMEAANAQIGVAISAYFPDLTLTGSYGYQSSTLGDLFKASSSLWSFGGSLAETVLDFGAREAQVAQNRALYDQAVANYRQTALSAFQQVEDDLAGLRVLEQQAAVQAATVASANEAVRLALNEYKAGTVAYTTVVVAQATALADAQNLLTIKQNRLTDSVSLIQALGGGWKTTELPASAHLDIDPLKPAAPPGS